MPIIDIVGRKKTSVKVFIAGLYILLTLGAITMVYPFLLMLSTSVTTEVDKNELVVIPKYLYSDRVLFQKYLYDKYSGTIVSDPNYLSLNETYGTDYLTFDEVIFLEVDLTDPKTMLRIKDWHEFRERLSEEYKMPGFITVGGATGRLARFYQHKMMKRFKGDIKELNKIYVEEHESFQSVEMPGERYLNRIWQPDEDIKVKGWEEIKADLPEEHKLIISGDGIWQTWLKVKYGKDINLLNKKYNTDYRSFSEIHLPFSLPESKSAQPDWIEFMKTRWPLHYLNVIGGEEEYRLYLQKKYEHINIPNKLYETTYSSFSKISLPVINNKTRIKEIVLSDWGKFVKEGLSPEYMQAQSAENLYREFLKIKYGEIDMVNRNYGTNYKDFLQISIPFKECDLVDLIKEKTSWRWYFLTKNYLTVIDYILLHGQAVLNTAVFCIAVIVTTIIINSFCAFALSRFNLKATDKILLFLLATMAFPAEVSMIPNFLLLKQFHMLNTYWALILPGMANGFSIFLLKGFFDSLPKELYESATLEGASEMKMFYKITIPLSKPVLAYLALQGFTFAYGSFMYALIVCQDPSKWTIMVWLYEIQNWAPSYVQMAAFTLATIPTLLVFVFAQKIIMQGIILPVEH